MAGVESALELIDEWVEAGAVPGVSVAVWHRGNIVAERTAGMARDGKPIASDTLFALASVSKPFTAAAIVKVLTESDTNLDTPLSMILPDFSSIENPFDEDALPQLEALRDRVTLRQLLCHTSGLPENAGVKRIRMSSMPSLDELTDVMCNLPLQSAPGTELRYSNAGVALAARAAATLDGRDIHTILKDDILTLSGLEDIELRPSPALDDRIAHVEDAAGKGGPSESYNSDYWRGLGMPWGGYYGTTRDVLAFAASFLLDQPNPLPPDLKATMVVDQTGGVPGGVNSAGIHWDHGSWGLGWEVKGTKTNHWTGTLTSPSTWCHWGQSGTLAWLDPEREIGLAVFGNRAVARAWPLRPPRWLELSDAVASAVEDTHVPSH